jgi:hypothetical protein
MQPFNYTINTGNAVDSFAGGYNRQMGMMANAEEFRKAQKLADAQQIANEQAIERQREFAEVAANPTADKVRRLMIKNPTLHEGLGKAMSSMSDQEKQSTLETSYSVLSALEKDHESAALEVVDRQISAAKQSKDADRLQRFEILRNSIQSNPNAVRFMLKGAMFANMGGDKYAEAMSKLEKNDRDAELQPGLVKKGMADASEAEAKASSAATDAKYADEKARTDIGNTRSQIEDRKFDQRIKVMESALKREDNALKREELQIKLDEARMKRDESQRGKVADYETARASVDNFLDTSARLKKNPMLSRVLGPIEGKFNTAPLSNEAADAVALIDTLKSQAFLSQVSSMKGTGALSEKEGAKLESALTSLSRVQSEKQFLENLAVAEGILSKVKENAANRSGVQPKQDEQKSAPVANDALARLKQKYGVK